MGPGDGGKLRQDDRDGNQPSRLAAESENGFWECNGRTNGNWEE